MSHQQGLRIAAHDRRVAKSLQEQQLVSLQSGTEVMDRKESGGGG